MSAKTKIIVLRMKELIYTGIFIGLVLFLVLLFFFMFRFGKDETVPTSADPSAAYYPGIYSSSLLLGDQHVNVEVTVDANRITSVALVPLSDSVSAMYPLMQPAMDTLAAQILELQSLEGLEYPAQSYRMAVLPSEERQEEGFSVCGSGMADRLCRIAAMLHLRW